ncbi:MAG: hypothetical protein ACXU86_23815 [Archangium sp.]
MNAKKMLNAVLITLPLMVAPTALASTAHTSSGSICQPNWGSPAISYFQSGRAFNTTTSTSTFVCPLERHDADNSSEQLAVWVYTISAYYNNPVCCTAKVVNVYGNAVASSGSVCATYSDPTATQTLYLSTPNVSTSVDSLEVLCTVPGTYDGNASSVSAMYWIQ